MILTLAWRSLWRNRRRTIITSSSIGFGLAFTLFFLTFTRGVHDNTITQATRMLAGQVIVERREYRDDPAPRNLIPSTAAILRAARLPEVERTKELISAEVMLSTAAGATGAALLGVDPQAEAATSPIAKSIVRGRYLRDGDARGVIVGVRLAEQLKLEPERKLVVTTADARGEMVEELLRVVGIFATSSEELDSTLVEVPLPVARRLLRISDDQATQVGIVLRDPSTQAQTMAAIAPQLPAGLAVLRWQEVLPELANWDMTSSYIHGVLAFVVLLLVTLMILNTVLMSVLERGREFAVLLAIGTAPRSLRAQVFCESLMLALLGCFIGLVVGGSASFFLVRHGIDLRSSFDGAQTVAGFPLDMNVRGHITAKTIAKLTGGVLALACAIGLYPTYRSTRIDISATIRSR